MNLFARLVVFGSLIFLLSAPGYGAPGTPEDGGTIDVKVNATRGEIPLSEISSSTSIISREQISASGAQDVLDVLRWVPGLQVVQTGGKGQFTSLFTRGLESNHTLIMIDGFQITSDGGTIDLGTLTLDNVERIEVVRGAGSAAFGSDAMGGVINIVTRTGGAITKDGETSHLRATTSFEAGTFGSMLHKNHVEGGVGPFSGAFERNYYHRLDSTIDNADFMETTTAGNFGFQVTDELSARLMFRDRSNDTEIFSGGAGPRFAATDPNDRSRQQEYIVGATVEHRTTDWWKQTLRVSKFRQSGRFTIRPNTMGAFGGRFLSEFRRQTYDWQHTFFTSDRNTLVAGFEWEEEKGQTKDVTTFSAPKSDPTNRTINRGYYVNDHAEILDDLFLTGGIRFDDNSSFGTEHTYRVGAAYTLDWEWECFGIHDTKFRANHGTGLKEPTLFERFSNSPFARGNPSLKPEEGRSWEFGVDQPLFNGDATFSYTYFHNTIKKLIDFDSSILSGPQFFNAGRAETMGHELGLTATPLPGLTVNGNVTFQDTEATRAKIASTSFIEGDRLLRRADVTASVNAHYRPQLNDEFLDRFETFVTFTYVGDRDDVTGGAAGLKPRQRNSGYTRTDVALNFEVCENLKLIGRGNNIFNNHYEEVLGFPADGATFMGGVVLSVDLKTRDDEE